VKRKKPSPKRKTVKTAKTAKAGRTATSAKTANSGKPAKSAKPGAASAPPLELIVRRGALRRFATLKQKSKGLPVKVTWDPRQVDRRASRAEKVASTDREQERRGSDRRQKPPFTWETADFLLIAKPPGSPAPKPNQKRKATSRKRT